MKKIINKLGYSLNFGVTGLRKAEKKKIKENDKLGNRRGYRSVFYTEEIDEDATV